MLAIHQLQARRQCVADINHAHVVMSPCFQGGSGGWRLAYACIKHQHNRAQPPASVSRALRYLYGVWGFYRLPPLVRSSMTIFPRVHVSVSSSHRDRWRTTLLRALTAELTASAHFQFNLLRRHVETWDGGVRGASGLISYVAQPSSSEQTPQHTRRSDLFFCTAVV